MKLSAADPRSGVRGYDGDVESLAFASAVELSRLIQLRKITSTALTKMYLARLKKFAPRLLCAVNLTEELAVQQAARCDEEIAAGKSRGPLHGIPYGAKDLLDTMGIATQYGSPTHRGRVAERDAPVIARLR